MIFEGGKILVVGMTAVLLLLTLMICIKLVAFLTRKAAARELEKIRKKRELQLLSRKKTKEPAAPDADEDIAVITAAVATYEAERFIKL